MLEWEELVANATLYVKQAIAMREMAKECIALLAQLLLYYGLCSESDDTQSWCYPA
jgi:hypothetical protein